MTMKRLFLGAASAVAASGLFLFGVPPAITSAISNVPSEAHVTITGTAVAPPKIPANAIRLKSGQPIPANAPIGQSYILPKRLPPNRSNMLVIHANPGQKVNVGNYVGPVVIIPTYPTVATIVPANRSQTSSTASSVSPDVGSPATSTTAVLTATFANGTQHTGGILDFNDTWVADNHVFNDYSNGFEQPSTINITYSDGYTAVQTSNIEDVYNQAYGLASPYNISAPYGSSYDITVVTHQTVGQSATVLSAWNPNTASFGDTTQSVTLDGINTAPTGYNPYPDPTTANSYNSFTPVGQTGPGWSGAGIWNSQNHLLGMVEGGNATISPSEIYAFNGQDISDFCDEYSINFSSSTGS